MGLDTSHDCWHGSYTTFDAWRQQVALAGGYTLKERSDVPFTSVDLPWDMFKEENYKGDWADGPAVEDPLLYLIVHSDADGVIHPEQGRHLAARLEQILPALTTQGAPDFAARLEQLIPGLTVTRNWMTQEWLEKATKQFIKGVRDAAAAGEDVEFY